MKNIYAVIGPPGAGKTTSMADWVQRQAAIFGPHLVLVSSFTRAAAAEIAGRNLGIPRQNVGTLHSFCYRLLGYPKMTAGKEKSFGEAHPMYHLSSGGSRLDNPTGEREVKTDGDKRLAQVDILRAKMTPPDEWPETATMFHNLWKDWKDQNGLLDFTDLLEMCVKDFPTAPGEPAVGVLDEAQDSSLLQLTLFLKWASSMGKAILAYDPDQAIYDFAGACPKSLTGLGIPAENKVVLGHSYRLPRAVYSFAEAWANGMSDREEKRYEPRDACGLVEPVDFRYSAPGDLIELAEDLTEKHRQENLPGHAVMILATCSYMLQKTVALLKEAAIPFFNPYRTSHAGWNPLGRGSEKKATTADRVLAFLRPDRETWGREAMPAWSGNELYLWASCLASKDTLKKGARAWIKKQKGQEGPFDANGLREYLKPDTIRALYRLDFQDPNAVKESLSWWNDHCLAAWQKKISYPIRVAIRHGGQALQQRPGIIVGTVHSVKGGEAASVFVFPDLSPSGVKEWMHEGPQRDSVIRLFYVAFTRARERLYLCARSYGRAVPLEAMISEEMV